MRLSTLLTTSALTLAMTASAALAAPDREELMKQHRGGTLKLNAHDSAGTIDPMINYEQQFWQLLTLTNDGLLAFEKVEGTEGNTIVPDLAEALPAPQDGGKIYVFKLRDGVTFSTGKRSAAEPLACARRSRAPDERRRGRDQQSAAARLVTASTLPIDLDDAACSRSATRSADIGRPSRKPCTSSQASVARTASCPSVSTPSAVTERPRALPRPRMARTTSRPPRRSSRSATN